MEETETSQRLNTISGHLTKALSSGGTSYVDLFKAYDELRTIESGESLWPVEQGQIFPNLLVSFLSTSSTYLFRRWAGILVARICHTSTAIASLFPRLSEKHGTHPFAYGIGNLILEEGVREDLKLICSLIIRSCVCHGVDHRIFWPKHKVPASFPIDDGPEWIDQFSEFTHALDAHLDSSKGYSLSSFEGLPEVSLRDRPLQRLIKFPNGIAVVALYFDISHVQFLDIPVSSLDSFEKESQQINLRLEDKTPLSVNTTISRTRQLTLRFDSSRVASAAFQTIEEAFDHSKTAKPARSPQRFATTELIDLGLLPPSTPEFPSQRGRRLSFAGTLDISLQSSNPDHNLRAMSGATSALARRKQLRNSESSSSLDEKSIPAKSATQPNPAKPDQVLVPDTVPTDMVELEKNTTVDDPILVPDSVPTLQGLGAAAISSSNATRNSQKAKTHGQEAPKSGSRGDASQTQKMVPENRKGTQTAGVKRPNEKSGDAKENGTTTRGVHAVEKKQKITEKVPEKQKALSKTDAFDPSHYDLPEDEDDGAAETSAPEPPPKRGHGRPPVQPHSTSKAVTTRSERKSKVPTQHLSRKPARSREDERSSDESDGHDDSKDEDFRATPPRGRHPQRKSGKTSSRVRAFKANQEASRKRGHSKLREQLSQPKSQEQADESGSELPRLDDSEPENENPLQDKPRKSQVPDSDFYGAQSRPESQQQQSELLNPQTAKDRSDEAQPASQKDRRGMSDVERQENEVSDDVYDYEDFEEVADFGENESLFEERGQTTTIEADSRVDPGNPKAIEGPEQMQEASAAINSDHGNFLSVSAPAPEDFIIPAALIAPAVQRIELERATVAANTVPTLDQEEVEPETRTNQPDETNREAVEEPPHSQTWRRDPNIGKTPNANSGQPDPSMSLFAKKPTPGNSSQQDPSSSISAERRLEKIDVANGEREIEETQETRDEQEIEESQETHAHAPELPLVDEHLHRKTRIIDFGGPGPRNQGTTPLGPKVAPRNQQNLLSSVAPQAKTPSHTMDQASNKRTPVTRGPKKYGSGPSRTLQEHSSFDEMLSSPERRKFSQKKKSLEDSQTIQSPDVESVVENIDRRKTAPEANDEPEPEHELSQLPTGTQACVSHQSGNLQGVKNPAIETGMNIKASERVPSVSDDDEFADETSFSLQTDLEPSEGIKTPLVETEVEKETRHEPLLESGGESQSAYESTSVPLAGIEQSAPSKSGPSPSHLDGKPASEIISSPIETHPSQFVPPPSATNRTKRRREEPAEDRFNLLEQSLALGRLEGGQQIPHYAEDMKRVDNFQNPQKRTKFDDQLSSLDKKISKKLSVAKKADVTAPSISLFKPATTLQRRMRRIREQGSPERFDDPQRSGFNIAYGNEAKGQAQNNRSPVLTDAWNASSPSFSRGVMSSNRKKLPDPPFASSKAITTHAPEHMLEQSELLNIPAQPEANPFSSPETPINRESKFAAMLRQKAEAQGVESANGKQDRKTPGLEALINARYEEDEDPDKTLVNDSDMGYFPDYDSDMSNASTLDEDEEEDEDLHLKSHHAAEMDWEGRLKPHQQDYALALSRVSQRLVRHLVDQETAIEDIIAAFEQDGNSLINEMERAHQEEFELERDTVDKAKTELQSMLEHMGGKLRNDKQLYEARRQKLRQEAEISGSSTVLKEQVGMLEGMLMELQG